MFTLLGSLIGQKYFPQDLMEFVITLSVGAPNNVLAKAAPNLQSENSYMTPSFTHNIRLNPRSNFLLL